MADYKKEGSIGDILYMENKDGKIADAGIVTDFKNGKIITEDADGKKHQYAEDNKKIVGFIPAVDDEIFDEPTTMADIAPTKPTNASKSSSKAKDEKIADEKKEAVMEAVTGYVATEKNLLNVREGAGKGFPVIGTLKKGDKVKIFSPASDGWYKLADADGYVMASCIKRS